MARLLNKLRGTALLAVCVLLAGCREENLLENLQEPQANEIIAVMLRNNISAHKVSQGKKGFLVSVNQRDLPEAIDLLRSNGLPSPPRTQIASVFPSDAMVSTPMGERARLLSAIEQRLEESLSVIRGVRSARVHVSYNTKEGSGAQDKGDAKMHVAAVLVHDENVDEQVLLQSVKRLLRNAFTQVDYDNVSVLLSPAEESRSLAATPERIARSSPWTAISVALLAGAGLLAGGLLMARRRIGAWAQRFPLKRPGKAKAKGEGGDVA